MKALDRFAKDESAASVIEYCLIASLVSIVILLAVNGLGATLKATYTSVTTAIN